MTKYAVSEKVTIENARLLFRNFSGRAGKYNREGERSFCVALDPQQAEELSRLGYNVRSLPARDEGDEPLNYMTVKVNYGGRPPRVVLVSSRGRTNLEESDLSIMDWVETSNVDLIFRPYNWEVSGNTGVTAYLQTLFVTIVENELDLKYADVPDAPTSAKPSVEEAPPWD